MFARTATHNKETLARSGFANKLAYMENFLTPGQRIRKRKVV